MIREDFHVHTTYCDGASAAEETVLAAIEKGWTRLGFSGHSNTDFDETWCMTKPGTQSYRAELLALREKYRDRLEILCGVEQDFFSTAPTDGYDYVIGSVHYLLCGGEYITVDESTEQLRAAIEKHFGGDTYALAEAYFAAVAQVVKKTGADLIGHFDLIAKYNDTSHLFDESHPRYVAAWQAAADALVKTGKPFEINTGAIARGYRSQPYPSADILAYLNARGAKFVLTSDCHRADRLGFEFDRWEQQADAMGLNLTPFLMEKSS